MRINGKTYCDVCLKEIANTCDTCFAISGEHLDSAYETQERHYCNEHRTWYELWYEIKNGGNIGQLTFPSKTEEKETKEVATNKEPSTLEVYDVITKMLAKYYGYLHDTIGLNIQFEDYFKKSLDTDIAYERLKLKGVVKDDE